MQFGDGGDEVGGELFGEGMDDEARVAGRQPVHDGGVFFLVAADGGHRRQAARHGVRAGRDALTERQMLEGGHGARRGPSLRGAVPVGNGNVCPVRHAAARRRRAAAAEGVYGVLAGSLTSIISPIFTSARVSE